MRLMLCLSFYEWRCIYPGEQMILAPFLEKTSLDRAPGRFADYLLVPKHAKADVLLTMVLGPLRGAAHIRPYRRGETSPGIIHPKFISTRSAGAWPSTIKLSIIRLSVPTCHWLSPSLLGPGGDAQLHPRVARLAWNMLAISVEFEASVSEQRPLAQKSSAVKRSSRHLRRRFRSPRVPQASDAI